MEEEILIIVGSSIGFVFILTFCVALVCKKCKESHKNIRPLQPHLDEMKNVQSLLSMNRDYAPRSGKHISIKDKYTQDIPDILWDNSCI